MGDVLGIDLGTTNCCVAVVGRDGRPRIIDDEYGRTVPSYVAVDPDGEYYVGENARLESIANPEGVIFGAKRLMGQHIDSQRVKQMMEIVPYKIVAGTDDFAEIEVSGQRWTPERVATVLLTHLRERTQQVLGYEVRDAVVSVPAHFDNNQRLATRNAAEAAGLNLLGLINEPTAAALAYGWATKAKSLLAVYDLGGGTFDITILEMGDGKYDVIATAGDTFLGGSDFDSRISVHVVRDQLMRTQLDPLNPISMLRLRAAAERAKIELSSQESTQIVLNDFEGVDELRVEITRDQLEKWTRDLVTATIMVCKQTLGIAGLKPYNLQGVLLVGGQTRMPAVREAVKGYFLNEPNTAMNPDEAVAAGAALHAYNLAEPEPDMPAVLLDVTPLTLGIRAAHDTFSKIIPAQTKVPCKQTETFTTYTDNQESVMIDVMQGENSRASQNTSLGRFTMDVAPGPRHTQKVDVTFGLDPSGILHVTARDSQTGDAKDITIEGFIMKDSHNGKAEESAESA